ncbi:MAG: hypothetical protein A3E82_02175 [Gammaproteobacteria bacterium RIFCSPHIGHO2_12_FULL_38_11]|nr:MAG: hypothetical protein A3E82_02175 [Gammaproteobacteria bacterium RIFCSPHIGHO2_12_FULL_38_11]
MKKLLMFIFSVTLLTAFQLAYANSGQITTRDLGPFALSVKKFNDKAALNKHHDHLLKEATDPKNSVLVRYTYALLLGINEPTPLTRNMAIEALAKLEKDPSLKQGDRLNIMYIRNLMLYQKQKLQGK